MCFHRLPPTFPLFRNRLSQSPLSEKLVHSDRHVWIPLEVPLNKGGDQLVAAVVANAEEVAPIAYAPLDCPRKYDIRVNVTPSTAVSDVPAGVASLRAARQRT